MRAGIQVRADDREPSASAETPLGVCDQERTWLLRTRDGDRDAFARLVEAYRAPVYAHLGRCGVDARDRDDLFQDIFLKIYRAAASYEAGRPVHPWVFTIVCNTVRTHLRKRRVRQLVFGEAPDARSGLLTEAVDETADGERRSLARERVQHLEHEIRRLAPVQREVVLLACVERMKLAQVASVLDLPVNTVKTHLRRARLALAKALAQRDRAPFRGGAEARS